MHSIIGTTLTSFWDTPTLYNNTMLGCGITREGGMEGMVKGLARLWKNILKRSDEDLGIDGEYTRPGVMAMLESFQESIESAESDPPFRFRFK